MPDEGWEGMRSLSRAATEQRPVDAPKDGARVETESEHLRVGEPGCLGRGVRCKVGEGHTGVASVAQAVGQLLGEENEHGKGGMRKGRGMSKG